MAITATSRIHNYAQKRRTVRAILAFDSSYPTGGESLTPEQVGLTQIEGMAVIGGNAGYSLEYDINNSKVKVFDGAGTEVPDTTGLDQDLSAVRVIFYGR